MRKLMVFYTFILCSLFLTHCNAYVLLRLRPGPEIHQFEHIGDSFVRERRNQEVSEDRLRRSGISHMLKQPILGMSQWWNNDNDQETLNNFYYKK